MSPARTSASNWPCTVSKKRSIRPPAGGIPDGTVEEQDVEGVAGALERAGVVDLGVVDVELARGAVGGPAPEKAVDEDVEVLAVVVAGLDDVAAVAVDEGAEVRGDDVVLEEDVGAILEIADPEGVRVVPGPAAAHRLLRDAELEARGPRFLEVPEQGRVGQDDSALGPEELVDGLLGATGLVALQLDGPLDDFQGMGPRRSPIGAGLPGEGLESSLTVEDQFPPEGGEGGLLADPVGKEALLLGDLLQESRGLFLGDLSEDHGLEERAPEKGPVFVFLLHESLRGLDPEGSSLNSSGKPLRTVGKAKPAKRARNSDST